MFEIGKYISVKILEDKNNVRLEKYNNSNAKLYILAFLQLIFSTL